jgi:hypothetical protein
VGYELKLTEDADNNNQLGDWNMGAPGDNNTTGTWTLDDPVPSLSTVDNSEIQPDEQHTPGGEFCYLTGNAGLGAGPGDNDVDAGRTTLISDPIDLTGYVNPTFTYWRWYTNNPPGGANPGADWWYAEITNNGTNWVFVENSMTSERAWRRKAFRVQDHVTPNSTVQIRFIASDSTHIGQNLDGGSLIEGLIDDIQLWDNADGDGVEEVAGATIAAIYPQPARDAITVRLELNGADNIVADVLDPSGRLVHTQRFGTATQTSIAVDRWASGTYLLRVRWDGGRTEERFTVVH